MKHVMLAHLWEMETVLLDTTVIEIKDFK